MATKYAISTEFSIVDRATAQLNRMSAAGKGFSGVWNRGIAQAQARLDSFGRSVASVGKLAAGIGVGAVSAGIVVATKQYADFDQAVRAAGAAYGPAFSQASDFEDKIKGMGAAVRAVAAATEFDATQSANALKTLALAGVQSEQAVALLPGVADLATAAMVDMDEAVGLAVGALNTMGMMSSSPEKLAANMTRLSDVMAYTANSANMSLADVSAAIGQGGSFFRTANNDLNILSGSLTALAMENIRGAEAGVALRNVMTNLSAPTAAAEKALSAMKVQTKDAAGNMLPLPKIIGQFSKAMSGMGDAERNANLYAIFGKQNIAAVTALLDSGQSALEGYAATAASSMGTAAANAEALRGSLVNKFKVLQSALTELGFKFIDAFAKKGGSGIDAITKAVNGFNPQPLVSSLVFVGNVIGGVAKVAWHLRYVIGFVAGAFILWRTATTAAAIALAAKNAVIAIATGAQIAYGIVVGKSAAATSAFAFTTGLARKAAVLFTGGLKLLTGAQRLLNAAFVASPIGWIILGIGALIGLAVALADKWRGISTAVDGFFARIRGMQGIGGVILRALVAPFELVWNQLRGIFDIVAAFKNGGFLAGIKMFGVTLLQALAAPLEYIFSLLSNIPGIGGTFAGWNESIHNSIEKMRADILAGTKPEESADSAAEAEAPLLPPTKSDTEAKSYSFSESVMTNRLEVGLAAGLEARPVGKVAPVFSIYAGR